MGYIIDVQIPCYGVAVLFALFAFFYSLRRIRLSEAATDWHLWLSLSGVAIFGFGFWLLARATAEDAGQHAGPTILSAIAAGLFLGPAAFLVGQLLLLAAIMRALVAHRS